MKKLVIIFSVILAIGYYIYFFVPAPKKNNPSPQSESDKEIHYHAGFLVYVDGTLQDFSDFQYMHIEPCETEEQENPPDEKENEQLEKAHLHDNIGNVVHVHRVNALWQDLFKNINFQIPQNKSLSGYKNGVKTDNLLNSAILPYDSVLFIIGDDKNIDKSQSVTGEYLEGIEEKTESC